MDNERNSRTADLGCRMSADGLTPYARAIVAAHALNVLSHELGPLLSAIEEMREQAQDVAELIEAAKRQRCTPCHNSGTLEVRPAPIGGGVISCDPYPCPHCASLRAALARCGGMP